MDFDNIIYVVIAVVLAIINAVAKKKKKSTKLVVSEPMEQPTDPIEAFFSELSTKKEPEPIIEQPFVEQKSHVDEVQFNKPEEAPYSIEYQQPSYEMLEEVITLEDTQSKLDVPLNDYVPLDSPISLVESLKEGEMSTIPQPTDQITEPILLEQKTENQLINELFKDFTPVKAILYSEILKPKYV